MWHDLVSRDSLGDGTKCIGKYGLGGHAFSVVDTVRHGNRKTGNETAAGLYADVHPPKALHLSGLSESN